MIGQALMVLAMAAPVGSIEGEPPTDPAPSGRDSSASEAPVALPTPPEPATTPPPQAEAAPAPEVYWTPPPSRVVAPWPDTRLFSMGLGIGLGARWGRRSIDGSAETGAFLLGSLAGRFAGYASDKPRFGGGRRFITPEMFVSLGLGSTLPSQTRVVGAEGVLRIGIGRSLATRISPYGKLQLDPRFAGYLHDIAEGNFITVALRGSAGLLGRTRDESFVFLAGGILDGVGGAQRIGPRSAIAQVMTGAELAIYAQRGEDLALMLGGDLRSTLLGQQRGGRRLEGRATLELIFGRSSSTALSALVMYSRTDIRVDTPLPRGAVSSERRTGHALLFGFGLSL